MRRSRNWRETIGRTAEDVADGFIRIAVENMANAIKRISVAKGYDARDYALNCFGGAGGQHACLVADALGMSTHLHSSVFGIAFGLWHEAARALRSVRQHGGRVKPLADAADDGAGPPRQCAGRRCAKPM